jgi:uncharacterized membrane protein (UPF0127 family)
VRCRAGAGATEVSGDTADCRHVCDSVRQKLGPNQGMVFLFGSPAGVCMWMKNTLIPLSVAFLDGNHKIINIEDMQAQTLNSHCAQAPANYALEMNLGWFKQKNIKPGMTIEGLPQ